jgi:hypothetical protein
MLEALHTLRRLLLNHGHAGQASVVAELIRLHDVDRDLFARRLQDGEVWGGSGSVWEVGDMGSDEIEYREGLILLADRMAVHDLDCKGSRFIAQTLRDWRSLGEPRRGQVN